MEKQIFTVTTIFSYYPDEEPNFDADYSALWVSLNGELLDQFGDWYHDKGDEKVGAFIKGYASAKGWVETQDYEIEYKNKAVLEGKEYDYE